MTKELNALSPNTYSNRKDFKYRIIEWRPNEFRIQYMHNLDTEWKFLGVGINIGFIPSQIETSYPTVEMASAALKLYLNPRIFDIDGKQIS